MTPEGRVKNMVKRALDKLGPDCWRFMPVQSGYGSVALDFLLAINGRFVAIETKAPGKGLTPLQEGTKAAIEAAGGLVFVVWDETSLELAMKIILALEFDPNGQSLPRDHAATTFRRLRPFLGTGEFSAVRHGSAEAQGFSEQHERTLFKDEAPDGTTGGDHGAS